MTEIQEIIKNTTEMYERDSLPLEDLEDAINNRLPERYSCKVYRTELETPDEAVDIINNVLDDILSSDKEFVGKYATPIEFEIYVIIVYKEK